MKNHCGFGKSILFKPPFWSFQNASCKIHDDNYEMPLKRDTANRLMADVGFLWRMCEDANEQPTVFKKKLAVYSAIAYFLAVRFFGWMSFFIWIPIKHYLKKK